MKHKLKHMQAHGADQPIEPAGETTDTVTVRHTGAGLVLRLFDMVDVGLGLKEARERPDSRLELASGDNEVPAAFWNEWAKQNEKQPNPDVRLMKG